MACHCSFLAYVVAPLRNKKGKKVAVGNLLIAEYATLRNDGKSMPLGFNIEDFNLLEGNSPLIMYSTEFQYVGLYLL